MMKLFGFGTAVFAALVIGVMELHKAYPAAVEIGAAGLLVGLCLVWLRFMVAVWRR